MSKYASRILAIDDEPRILRFLQSNLQLASYTVQTTTFGTEGLKLALETAPDLVLLDLGLPDLDGLEVLRRLRLQSDAPVIIITARDDEESMVAGLKLGADDYLTSRSADGLCRRGSKRSCGATTRSRRRRTRTSSFSPSRCMWM